VQQTDPEHFAGSAVLGARDFSMAGLLQRSTFGGEDLGRINEVLAAGMTIVVVVFSDLLSASLLRLATNMEPVFFSAFYDPATFNLNSIFHGTSSRY